MFCLYRIRISLLYGFQQNLANLYFGRCLLLNQLLISSDPAQEPFQFLLTPTGSGISSSELEQMTEGIRGETD